MDANLSRSSGLLGSGDGLLGALGSELGVAAELLWERREEGNE